MRIRPFAWLTATGAVVASAILGFAQIESFTLDEMVAATENAVYGEIVDRFVFKEDHPIDGDDLYFTVLTVQGTSLVDGKSITTTVTFPGGFISETEGVYNSEAPSQDDVKLGNKVVVFYKYLDNMGGDVSGNRLWASHGGLFRTFATRRGVVVQGRGEGYAIPSNTSLPTLSTRVAAIAEEIRNR